MDLSHSETVWSDDIDALLCNGVDLRAQGICNWALTSVAALQAVQELATRGVAVLGGDVYRRAPDGRVESTYDNWYCNRAPSDTDASFVQRCREAALGYIQRMAGAGRPDLLFAIVPRV